MDLRWVEAVVCDGGMREDIFWKAVRALHDLLLTIVNNGAMAIWSIADNLFSISSLYALGILITS